MSEIFALKGVRIKVLVPVKRVVDYNVKVRVKSDKTGIETAGVKMSMNPFDEIAVEEAIRLKEAGTATEVVLISIGEAKAEETLRTGLAMGGDRAILVQSDEEVFSLQVAQILKTIVDKESPDLVILGKQAIDDDASQVGQMLAATLGWGQATFISELQVLDGKIDITREVDEGLVKMTLPLPAIVTTDLRLNEPRYVALPSIMRAKSKPLEKLPISEIVTEMSSKVRIVEVNEPEARAPGVKVANVDELVTKLVDEAAII